MDVRSQTRGSTFTSSGSRSWGRSGERNTRNGLRYSLSVSRRWLAVLGLLVGLLVLLWWLLCDHESPAAYAPSVAPLVDRAAAPRPSRRRASSPDVVGDSSPKDADSAAPETAAPAKPSEKRVLRIVDSSGKPIGNVSVGVKAGGDRWTDKNGESVFEVTEKRLLVYWSDGAVERTVELVDPRTDVVAETFPRLLVDLVDATTGASLPPVTAWFYQNNCGRIELRTGATTGPTVTARDGWWAFQIGLDPPLGYGVVDPEPWQTGFAVQARRVRWLVPAFPEVTVEVKVVDEDSVPVAGSRLTSAWTEKMDGGQDRTVSHRDDVAGTDGVISTRVPAVPFAKLTFRVSGPPRSGGRGALGGEASGVRVDAGSTRVTAVLREPARGGSGSAGVGGSGGGSVLLDWRGSHSSSETAPLDVVVLRTDGSPACRVYVVAARASGWTDGSGRVHLASVESGPCVVLAQARGFLPTAVRATIGAEEQITIRETASRRVLVTVEDPSGHPLPAALVTSTSLETPGPDGAIRTNVVVTQLDGDTELLTPLTGFDGTITLAEPPGVVRYDVSLGGGHESVEAREDVVRVVMRDARK